MFPVSERSIKHKNNWVMILFYALLLSSCASVGPNYEPPVMPLPEAWHGKESAGINNVENGPGGQAAWWRTLGDPELTGLIEQAVSGNLDLKIVASRIVEARARRGMTRAAFFPTLDVQGSGSRDNASERIGRGARNDLYQAGFDATWEVDIFGGKRRGFQAAAAELAAAEEERRDALVSLLAEVALNYMDARSYQARLSVITNNLKTQDETLQLTRWLKKAGLTDELAVEQARTNLETTRARLPEVRTGFAEAANRLALLLGQPPGTVHEKILSCTTLPEMPDSIAIGVPADLLRQRPDIRRAERNLAAQTAQIGVATAELYPKFSLNGSIGLEALALDHLFSSDSKTDSRSALISWRIFDAGSVRNAIRVQTALQEQSLFTYESTVLSALSEVENALVAFHEEQERKKSLKAATQSARNSIVLARNNYKAGLIDFIAVLDAERSVLSLEDQLVQSRWSLFMSVVRLYKAMGGGWHPFEP